MQWNRAMFNSNICVVLIVKVLYRLRFIPLLLSIVFLLYSIFQLWILYFVYSAVALPYQDPTPEVIYEQMDNLYYLEPLIQSATYLTIAAFCTTVLSLVFLFYIRHKRKQPLSMEGHME